MNMPYGKQTRIGNRPLQSVHVAGTHEPRGFSPNFRAGPASVGVARFRVSPGHCVDGEAVGNGFGRFGNVSTVVQ